jgi:extracellular elastinolytic metalloproteinase
MLAFSATFLTAFVINTIGVDGSPVLTSNFKVDVNRFRLETSANYFPSLESSPKSGARPTEFDATDYVKIATSFVQATVPNATFRLVGDHYIGAAGIGHVYFKQTMHGLDVDNADFNVNVSFAGLKR